MSRFMRAKMVVMEVTRSPGHDRVKMSPVIDSKGVPEDNDYSKYTPSGSLELAITNETLIGKIEPGKQFYVDFVEVPSKPAE